MASAADLTLTEATTELAKVRAAISRWRETGVIEYGKRDRSGRISIDMLKADEQDLMARIRQLEAGGRGRGRMRRIVPVDLR